MTRVSIVRDREKLRVIFGPRRHLAMGETPSWMVETDYGEAILNIIPEEESVHSDTLYIEDFRIKLDFRGSGHGTKLFQEVENFAKRVGADWLELNSVPTAIDFWHKMGFRLTEEVLSGLRPTMIKQVGVESCS